MMKKGKPLILIVDDDTMMIDNLNDIVKGTGRYETICANNGYQALDVLDQQKSWSGLAKNKVDCILLDVKMPHMNGLEFLKKWRDSEYFFDFLPIVLLTAYETFDIWNHTMPNQGLICEYLKKPIQKAKLLHVLEKIVFNREGDFMREVTRERGKRKIVDRVLIHNEELQ